MEGGDRPRFWGKRHAPTIQRIFSRESQVLIQERYREMAMVTNVDHNAIGIKELREESALWP